MEASGQVEVLGAREGSHMIIDAETPKTGTNNSCTGNLLDHCGVFFPGSCKAQGS